MKSLLTTLLVTILVLTFQNTLVGQWLPTGTVTTDAKYRSGSIGIGMTGAPLSGTTLQLHSTSGPVMTLSNATSGANALLGSIIGRGNGYSYNTAKIDMNIEDLWGGGNYSSRISFWTTGNGATITERMRIDKNGNVGIGTTTPIAKLDINGTLRTNNTISLFSGSTTYIAFTTANSYFNGGNVGIGTTTPGAKLDINGTLRTNNNISLVNGSTTYLNLTSGVSYFNGGTIGIGTSTPNTSYKLDVVGKVRANEVVVNTTGADFVFENDYNLRNLSEVESFIKENKHLPEIPNAEEMQQDGMSLSEMNTKLLQKVEELTLYIIDQEKRIIALESK